MIYHLSHPYGRFVNFYIFKELRALKYTIFNEARQEIIQVVEAVL